MNDVKSTVRATSFSPQWISVGANLCLPLLDICLTITMLEIQKLFLQSQLALQGTSDITEAAMKELTGSFAESRGRVVYRFSG